MFANDKSGEPDFTSYPKTEAFDAFLRPHRVKSKHLIVVTSIHDAHTALEYEVTRDGKEFDVTHVHNWAHQASHKQQLDGEEIEELGKAISDRKSVV